MSVIREYDIQSLPHRLGVGMMIVNKKNQIFVGKRVDTKMEAWQMPQGGIELGETPSKAAFREMKEEVGSDNGMIIAESKYWYRYDLPKFLVPKLWNGNYRGQQQKWFLIKFNGDDSEINIHSDSREFEEWRWADITEIESLIIPFKKKLYRAVILEFYPFINV